jgi:hypothetical protein
MGLERLVQGWYAMNAENEAWPDGWTWRTPPHIALSEAQDELDVMVEALRRAVDLRDHLAEQGVGSSRPVMLTSVLNDLFEHLLAQRLPENFDLEPYWRMSAWEMVEALRREAHLRARE